MLAAPLIELAAFYFGGETLMTALVAMWAVHKIIAFYRQS